MGKISLDDAYEKVGPNAKGGPPGRPEEPDQGFLPLISLKELVRRIRKANLVRLVREAVLRFYLRRTVGSSGGDQFITWQPLYWIIIKLALLISLSYLLYLQFPLLSGWLSQGLAFFRLNEIYNFEFPKQPFFDTLAQGIILVVIGYYGLFFLYHQGLALFSSLVINPKEKRAYYIKSLLVKKDVYIFSLPELDRFTLRQVLPLRLLGLGTILVRAQSGENIAIRSVARAGAAIKKMSDLARSAGRDKKRSRRSEADE